jgi:hypothetical protein
VVLLAVQDESVGRTRDLCEHFLVITCLLLVKPLLDLIVGGLERRASQ